MFFISFWYDCDLVSDGRLHPIIRLKNMFNLSLFVFLFGKVCVLIEDWFVMAASVEFALLLMILVSYILISLVIARQESAHWFFVQVVKHSSLFTCMLTWNQSWYFLLNNCNILRHIVNHRWVENVIIIELKLGFDLLSSRFRHKDVDSGHLKTVWWLFHASRTYLLM